MAQKIALFSLMLFLTLASLEGLSRIYAMMVTDYESEMWRYAKELKMEVPDNRYLIHRPSVRTTLMGVEVLTDEKGRRRPEEPLDNTSRTMAVLGDSVTFGWGVPAEQTFPELIGKGSRPLANPLRILNYGIGNHNMLQLQAKFQKEVLPEKPDILLWVFYINDIEMTPASRENVLSQHLLSVNILYNLIYKMQWWAAGASSYESYYQTLFAQNHERLRAVLSEVARDSHTIPERYALLVPDLNSHGLSRIDSIYSEVEKDFQDAGFKVLNLQTLHELKSPSYWVSHQDAHPNAPAHQLIARSFCQTFPNLCREDFNHAQ